MAKILSSFGGVLLLVLVLGAGCNKTDKTATPAPQSKPAEEIAIPDVATQPTNEAPATDLKLTAEAKGNASVQFNWEASEDLAKRAVVYRIVHGEEPNPTWPSTYYFQRGPMYREKLWMNLPLGKQNFRVCVVEGGQCTVYSNNVEVEVK